MSFWIIAEVPCDILQIPAPLHTVILHKNNPIEIIFKKNKIL